MIIDNYFKKRKIALSDDILMKVEQANKCILPKVYKDFIKNYEAGPQYIEGEWFGFLISNEGYEEITWFIGFAEAENLIYNHNRFSCDDALEDFLIIAYEISNTFFCICLENSIDYGKFFYFDCDSWGNKRFWIADNFEEFIEKLQIINV